MGKRARNPETTDPEWIGFSLRCDLPISQTVFVNLPLTRPFFYFYLLYDYSQLLPLFALSREPPGTPSSLMFGAHPQVEATTLEFGAA